MNAPGTFDVENWPRYGGAFFCAHHVAVRVVLVYDSGIATTEHHPTPEAHTMTAIAERKTALFARTATPLLVQAMVMLDAVTNPSQEERITLAWIRGEIERRIPAVDQAIEAAFDAAAEEEERTGEYVHVEYTAVVLAAIAGLTAPNTLELGQR